MRTQSLERLMKLGLSSPNCNLVFLSLVIGLILPLIENNSFPFFFFFFFFFFF
jgi:hypothetical protein